MEYLNVVSWIGNFSSGILTKIIKFLSSFGYNLTATQGKILNMLLIVGVIWLILKIVEKPAKWFFITLLVLLALSIGISFVN